MSSINQTQALLLTVTVTYDESLEQWLDSTPFSTGAVIGMVLSAKRTDLAVRPLRLLVLLVLVLVLDLFCMTDSATV